MNSERATESCPTTWWRRQWELPTGSCQLFCLSLFSWWLDKCQANLHRIWEFHGIPVFEGFNMAESQIPQWQLATCMRVPSSHAAPKDEQSESRHSDCLSWTCEGLDGVAPAANLCKQNYGLNTLQLFLYFLTFFVDHIRWCEAAACICWRTIYFPIPSNTFSKWIFPLFLTYFVVI